ncbi:MAG: glycosyltransferase family 39 protein [Candidatus Omnitrophica bacterium]|nr:glycosyltransferase family 39 protein [Candidatus Omnitrophota bacterium]
MILRKEIIIVVALLAFFLMSGLYYAFTNSITSDEKTHIATGYLNIRFNDYRFNVEHPPLIKQLAAIPLLFMNLNFPQEIYKNSTTPMDIVNIQEAFLFKMGNDLDAMLFFARLPNILFGILLGFAIYLFSRELNGKLAGLISLGVFVFSPTFLGHSPLVTMDVAVSCFYFFTVYSLMNYFSTKKSIFLYIAGIGLGVSLAAKFSALVLIPALYALIIAMIFTKHFEKQSFILKMPPWKIILLIPVFIFAVSYKGSVRFMIPAFAIFFISVVFCKIDFFAKNVRFAAKISLLLLILGFAVVILDYTQYDWFPNHSATKAYFKGFENFKGHASGGHPSYLLGHYSNTGWWYYFPLTILFKEPITTLGLVTLGFIGILAKKQNDWRLLFVFIPMCAYLFVACFLNKANMGIRHIMPALPFLYVIAGYSVTLFKKYLNMRLLKLILPGVILTLCLEVVTAYPAHLSYFNVASGGISNGYKLLSDSNIAWGQDFKRLKQYLERNGINHVIIDTSFGGINAYDYYKIPYRLLGPEEKINPVKGFYVIDTLRLQASDIQWLDKYKPISRIGGSLLIYQI